MHQALKDVGPFAGHAPERERPLGGYAALTSTFFAAAGTFAAWLARSGREVPPRVDAADFALIATSTHKLSRLIAKDRVTSFARAPFTRFEDDAGPGEVSEEARGHGLRRAVGELLVCPYCLGLWVASAETAGLLVAPRATRWTMTALSALLVSDVLQMAYAKAEDQL
jgi:hypothetical protein